MPQDFPRFAPEIGFPPYTYIPKRTPHPISDPAGHSFGIQPPPLPSPLCDWRRSVEYRQGIDLFNHGYYWEAHEVWEGLWHASGRTGPLAQVLQGLIKLAAAGVKTVAGSDQGRRRHSLRAAELFDQAAAAPPTEQNAIARAMGLSLRQLAAWARAAATDGSTPAKKPQPAPESPAREPQCVFSFRLLPVEGGES